jgi:hypothetical protein
LTDKTVTSEQIFQWEPWVRGWGLPFSATEWVTAEGAILFYAIEEHGEAGGEEGEDDEMEGDAEEGEGDEDETYGVGAE